MPDWNASHYMRFATERTRAASDLIARIDLKQPKMIADLGCGPGNSTSLLWQRWPEAEIVGIDQAADMIKTAQRTFPDGQWLNCNIREWTPHQPVDLLYSNAALHWLPDHAALLPQLVAHVAKGGVLAFQVPSVAHGRFRELIAQVSCHPAWTDRMAKARSATTAESPAFYYDTLTGLADSLDIWESEYQHTLPSKAAILDWISATTLRPFLDALDSEIERRTFCSELLTRIEAGYESRRDGRVLFPFRRTFVIAYC